MGLISRVSSRTYRKHGSTQKSQDQEGVGESPEAKPTFATMVSIQNRQQNPVQCQATTLETNQARTLNQAIFSKFFELEEAVFICLFDNYCFNIERVDISKSSNEIQVKI